MKLSQANARTFREGSAVGPRFPGFQGGTLRRKDEGSSFRKPSNDVNSATNRVSITSMVTLQHT